MLDASIIDIHAGTDNRSEIWVSRTHLFWVAAKKIARRRVTRDWRVTDAWLTRDWRVTDAWLTRDWRVTDAW